VSSIFEAAGSLAKIDSSLNPNHHNQVKQVQILDRFTFGQAKFPDGGSVLGLSQFSILLQLPLKTIFF